MALDVRMIDRSFRNELSNVRENQYNPGSPGAAPPSVNSGIADALQELERTVKRIDEVSVQLQEKMTGFMLPEGVTTPAGTEKAPPQPLRSEIANHILERAAQLDHAASRLRIILARLDF